jgi:RNA polymerase sigma-70 factor (ECF subfamily)
VIGNPPTVRAAAPATLSARDDGPRPAPDERGPAGSGSTPAIIGDSTPLGGGAEAMLIARLKQGDEAAFLGLVSDHGRTLRRIARLYASDAVAEEVVQETWIAVIQGIDRFEGRSSLRTWMVTILINIARNRGEREKRQIPFSAFEDTAAGSEPAVDPDRFQGPTGRFPGGWISFPERWDEQPEARFLSAEGVDAARQAIAALPPAQREVVTLRDVEGWPSEEVSAALGITPGNERVLLHRGRSRVRAVLERAMAADAVGSEAVRS